MNFKVGDVVRCVDDMNVYPSIKKGVTYTVTKIKVGHSGLLLNLNKGYAGFYASRFEPLTFDEELLWE